MSFYPTFVSNVAVWDIAFRHLHLIHNKGKSGLGHICLPKYLGEKLYGEEDDNRSFYGVSRSVWINLEAAGKRSTWQSSKQQKQKEMSKKTPPMKHTDASTRRSLQIGDSIYQAKHREDKKSEGRSPRGFMVAKSSKLQRVSRRKEEKD
ncbi:unnamed protein product [Linum trigynum]|uniref:Uncharacterized protein n=1 Tax=Linum trigynum TaxID=586398 RepID=A0AAV2E8Y8_9ROSI